MATSQGSEMQLEHLGFVRILAINAAVLVSNLYIYAKQNSGPLKSTVEKVEDAVTTVVSPVYERFKGIPTDILVFLDKKVDEATYKFDERAPPAAKNAASKAHSIVMKASKVLQDLAEEAKVDGPLAAISHAVEISKHFSVDKLAFLWYKANQYPALHGVFQMAVPTAAYWSDKYNKLVKDMSSKGYSFFNYVPLIPVEEMAKAYKQVEAAAGKKADTGSSSESESNKE
ncbi:REF/SRPP-like protein At1g67360 isoform X2 [Sesamum indicum]|uniref:REF/SRPP-like protein At1g67360 isoform X2 n=1 Tax=Sesamum indicum TaxID=4182 RepID=A0A6I9SV17_SESIN|nr:REF/SRPP-like protein At1g67360 isoform X2 [Sesamum indicum]